MIGATISNYRIVQELGTGAMGTVYEAVDTLVERPVAIKVLRAELARQPELVERFRSEAITLARLNHPNIALLYNFFQQGGDYFMAMEFVRGRPLESFLHSAGRLEPDVAARIMSQTLDGVAHAHRMGVLHRDIKPANILVTGDGYVKVTDFGIARVLGSSRTTRHGRIIGTLEYIAPERIRGDESDPRSDLYSAGVVLYEMLAGRLPFTGQTDFELLKAHLEQEPPALEEILGTVALDGWNAIVHKALAKPPERRFQSAEEFQREVVALATSSPYKRSSTAAGIKQTGLAEAGGTEARLPSAVSRSLVRLGNKPPATLLLIVAGVLLVLAIAVTMRLQTMREVKKEAPAIPVTEPLPSVQSTDSPQQDLRPNNEPQNEARPKEDGVVVIPASHKGSEVTPRRPSAPQVDNQEKKRQAALRALEEGDAKARKSKSQAPESKDPKRSQALKALEHK